MSTLWSVSMEPTPTLKSGVQWMIGIESFQYLQMSEGLRKFHDATDPAPSTEINKASIASANNTWFCEN
jgi:hypothetical protein